jgi:hypothetical protein
MPKVQQTARFMLQTFFAALLFSLAALSTAAQETSGAPPNKTSYNLFKPVPEVLMRELQPDRPDKTESPYTVDAGHFQLEMDFANYTYHTMDGTTKKAWNAAPFNIKAGLFNNVDVQLIFEDYLYVRTQNSTTGKSTLQSGVGDLTARLKINLWGGDGGPTAFGLLPYAKFPTSTDSLGNNAVEGGIICPLSIKLPGDFDMGVEMAFAILHNDSGGNYHGDFISILTVDRRIIGKLSGYLEFFSDISTQRHSNWVGTVDAGLEFLITENVQLDCGCNFGVTSAADNFNPFSGVTVRF